MTESGITVSITVVNNTRRPLICLRWRLRRFARQLAYPRTGNDVP